MSSFLRNGAVSSGLLLSLLRCSAASTDDPAVTPPPIFNLGEEYNPTMALIMVVLVGAFFVIGFFSVYIRHCAQRRIRGAAAAAEGPVIFIGARRPWRTAASGVGDEVVRSFPRFLYSSVKGVKGSLECAVCLNEFVDNETLRLLPKCRHVFHSDCVDAWLSTNSTCPVCRADLVPKPGEDSGFTAVQIPDPDPDNSSGEPETNVDGENMESIVEVNVINQDRLSTTNSTERLYLQSDSIGHSSPQTEHTRKMILSNFPKAQSEPLDCTLKRMRSLGTLLPSERNGYRNTNSNIHYDQFR